MRAAVSGSGHAVAVGIADLVIVTVTENVVRDPDPEIGKGYFCFCLFDWNLCFLDCFL